MLTIGLTGGIGSGKTAASNLFSKLGVPIIDADIIGHQITQAGHTAYNRIRSQWSDCFTSSGKIDRSALRRKVFSNPEELAKLEAILHPAIQAEIEEQKKQLSKEKHDYCLIVIPLLLEKQWQHLVDKIIVLIFLKHYKSTEPFNEIKSIQQKWNLFFPVKPLEKNAYEQPISLLIIQEKLKNWLREFLK